MKLLTGCTVFLLFFAPCFGGEKDLETFQKVWDTVNENHWDLEGTGVDWQKVYETYKPKILKTKNRTETRKVLSDMLDELGQSHFQIMEANTGDAEELRSRYGGTGSTGFVVALIEERVFIVKIDHDSDAFRQGLGIGTEITKVDDKNMKDTVAEILEAFEGEPNANVYVPGVLNDVFAGTPGDKKTLDIVVDGKERTVTVPLMRNKGEYKDLMNLTDLFFTYESKVLPGNIGYVHFNIFLPDASTRFVNDMNTIFKDTDGLIIDVRGNPGGMGILAVTFSNRLIKEKDKRLGHMMNKGGKMNFPIFPQKPHYDKPVAVLIDEGSASTSEILAGGLQDLDRARVFGVRTAGAALPSIIVDLPNGDRFQYAIADYVTYNGRHIEGIGVSPDVKTPHTLESMAKKQDASITAASEWIKDSNNGVKNETF